MNIPSKKSKKILWLSILIIFLLIWGLIIDAFLKGQANNKYSWQCRNNECQIQTISWFGWGKSIEKISFSQSTPPLLKYSDYSRLPHYYLIVDSKRLPMSFYFSKSALNFINQLQSGKDFSGNAYSLMLLYFLFVLGVAYTITATIILLSPSS